MAWNGGVWASPIEEGPSGRSDTLLDAVILPVILDLIDHLAIETKNRRFDISLCDEVNNSLMGFPRALKLLLQLAATPRNFYGICVNHHD